MMGHNFGVGALAIVGLFLIAGQVKSAENDWESIRAQSRLSEKINRFSFSLLNSLIESDHGIARDENAAISPMSVWVSLSMALNGASGYTKREMEQVLFWKNTHDDQLALAALGKMYNDISNKWEVDTINTIFYNNSYNIKSSYNDMVRNHYKNEIKSVDFSRTDDTHNAINTWADHESRSHIKDFMPKVKFNSSFSMLLVSGAYMRGIWAVPFHETSVKRAFLMRHGNTNEVSMLHAYGLFSVGYLFPDYSATIIKIDYEGGYVSNYIVIPKGHNLDDFEKNLRSMHLNDFETHYYAKKMNLYVPKLRINSTFCLERPLRKLGMNKMWTKEAEFTDVNTEDKPMWANKVFHKASIVVDEYNNPSTNQQAPEPNTDAENFYVDRPFYMMTVSHGVVIFMTRVIDPTSLF